MHKAWCGIGEVHYCSSSSSVKFQGHTGKIADFDPKWAFPDCNLSLNSLMDMKWRTKLEATSKRCPVVFQGHPSNFKVTRDKKIADFEPNWVFPDCIISLNSPMVWNDAQSLPQDKRGALLFFKVIHWISMSHGTKNYQFWPELSVSGL